MSNVNQEPKKDSQVSGSSESQLVPATTKQDSSHSELKDTEYVSYEVYTKSKLRIRFFSALNHLSIQLYVIVVYTGIFFTDYFILWLIGTLLQDDIQNYEMVALWFDRLKIGLAILLMIFAIVHGLLSTISQIKLDWEIFRKGDSSWEKTNSPKK